MHSTSLFAPLLLLATLSSALPAPAAPLDSSSQLLDERSGNWKAPIFEALGIGRRAVLNATLESRKYTPRRIVYNPKYTGYVTEVTSSAGSGSVVASSASSEAWSAVSSSSSAAPSSSATSSATSSSAAPSSTSKTCAVTADCAGQTIPASSHQYCASKVCSFRCNSGYTLSKGACVKNAGTTTLTTVAATTSVAPSSTSTTTSAATTSSAASSVTPFTGQATFFYQYGVAGACGNVNADSTPLVALDWRLYGNLNQESQYCGRSLTITNTDNGKSVVAIVADACPSCASQYSLDLSTGAFDAIGDQDTGVLPISWVWN
ncbi:RlpA-like double-psi beta-barrel-protein domain-containing protein-containing protein [Leucosporidium creatinivorum]|uniref:RlpA-like double-psi beta-barrel-protein domain-containing protein-containing protein n=1 Tax=Leucosporidium creatinivorum TaxID=106004 RepID=A0A1Y2FHR6_9BASI|nr:RlpA-like double-psi beta-barrel-protein domain-containing protein-containing protein [Leucosporidium creatinivorum]